MPVQARYVPQQLPTQRTDAGNLSDYRNKPIELARVADLMRLIPAGMRSALDIGARDGYISSQLADRIDAVTALDLSLPQIDDARVVCVRGNATELNFADGAFDVVFCAEVLEHIPSPALEAACRELARVAGRYVLIGVPYKQDIRQAQTTCMTCGGINPPWAHLNSFDERRLETLFAGMRVADVSFVGEGEMGTNRLSAALMNFAGNPFGTYSQEEPCIHCHSRLLRPAPRTAMQKIATRTAVGLRALQALGHRARGNWIHVLFEKT